MYILVNVEENLIKKKKKRKDSLTEMAISQAKRIEGNDKVQGSKKSKKGDFTA